MDLNWNKTGSGPMGQPNVTAQEVEQESEALVGIVSGVGTEGGHQLIQVKIKTMRLGCVSREKSNGWKTTFRRGILKESQE